MSWFVLLFVLFACDSEDCEGDECPTDDSGCGATTDTGSVDCG